MYLTKFTYSEGRRENMRCRFQKIEAWDGSLQRLWQRSVSTRKAPKSQVSSSFCPTETSNQGENWDLDTLRTSCPTFDVFWSSTLPCCYIFSSTNIYCNVIFLCSLDDNLVGQPTTFGLSVQPWEKSKYNYNRMTHQSCYNTFKHIARLTKISIFMVVIILSNYDHHICLLSYLSLIDARYHHNN